MGGIVGFLMHWQFMQKYMMHSSQDTDEWVWKT